MLKYSCQNDKQCRPLAHKFKADTIAANFAEKICWTLLALPFFHLASQFLRVTFCTQEQAFSDSLVS